jgi:hypothetical protein
MNAFNLYARFAQQLCAPRSIRFQVFLNVFIRRELLDLAWIHLVEPIFGLLERLDL